MEADISSIVNDSELVEPLYENDNKIYYQVANIETATIIEGLNEPIFGIFLIGPYNNSSSKRYTTAIKFKKTINEIKPPRVDNQTIVVTMLEKYRGDILSLLQRGGVFRCLYYKNDNIFDLRKVI